MEPSRTPFATGGSIAPEHPLIPAGRVSGTAVYNTEGDKLGVVDDVAIDKLSGRVAYAILSFGGFLGMGERRHPAPWDLLTYDVAKHGYVIPLSKVDLENAPSFEPHELSGWDDTHTRKSIYDYYAPYGVIPYW